jgi:hypothetical protein
VLAPSLIWKRGSLVESVDTSNSSRPSSAVALRADGNRACTTSPSFGAVTRAGAVVDVADAATNPAASVNQEVNGSAIEKLPSET